MDLTKLYDFKYFLGEIAYHVARSAENKKPVQLRMDMFILTFAIYGIMIMLAFLVFLEELKIGKRSLTPENDEAAKNKESEAQDESENRPNMETSVAKTQDNPDEINVVEIL